MTLHHLPHCFGILEAMESLWDSRFQVVHSPKTFKRGNEDSTVEHEQERLKLHVANQLRFIIPPAVYGSSSEKSKSVWDFSDFKVIRKIKHGQGSVIVAGEC
jgi:hypothetical protein